MKTLSRAACVIAIALCIGPIVSRDLAAQTISQARTKDKLGMDEARALVLDLPEVKAWREERRKAAAADPKAPATAGILTGSRTPGGKKHWSVTFYKNPSTQAEKWATFLVRTSDAKLFVEGENGNPLPLELWRRGIAKPDS